MYLVLHGTEIPIWDAFIKFHVILFFRPQKDPYYDFTASESDRTKDEEKKKQQARQSEWT